MLPKSLAGRQGKKVYTWSEMSERPKRLKNGRKRPTSQTNKKRPLKSSLNSSRKYENRCESRPIRQLALHWMRVGKGASKYTNSRYFGCSNEGSLNDARAESTTRPSLIRRWIIGLMIHNEDCLFCGAANSFTSICCTAVAKTGEMSIAT